MSRDPKFGDRCTIVNQNLAGLSLLQLDVRVLKTEAQTRMYILPLLDESLLLSVGLSTRPICMVLSHNKLIIFFQVRLYNGDCIL